jgi:hypothetical protein
MKSESHQHQIRAKRKTQPQETSSNGIKGVQSEDEEKKSRNREVFFHKAWRMLSIFTFLFIVNNDF